jgi:methionine-rich copper-binding protein CopC
MPRLSHRRRLAAALSVVLAALGLGLAGAAPASAHTELVSVSPGFGKRVVVAAPLTVTLTFTDAIDPTLADLVLLDHSDHVVETAPVDVDGSTVMAVTRDVPDPGEYVVRYRVVSGDGHPVDGESEFRVAAPRPAGGEEGTDEAATAPGVDESPGSGTDAEVTTAATVDESAGAAEATAAAGAEDGDTGSLLALGLVVTLGGVVTLVAVARRHARAGASAGAGDGPRDT